MFFVRYGAKVKLLIHVIGLGCQYQPMKQWITETKMCDFIWVYRPPSSFVRNLNKNGLRCPPSNL